MFAVGMKIDLLFARSSSLSRPASLDLTLFTKPSEPIMTFNVINFIDPEGKRQ